MLVSLSYIPSSVDISKYLDWIKLSPRYLLPIALFTGFLLFAPPELLARFGLIGWVEGYRQFFGLGFLLSATLLLSSGIMAIYDYAKGRKEEARLKNQRQQKLHKLSEPEKEVLRNFVHNQTTTQYLSIADGVVGGLEAKHILYRTSNVGGIYEWAYNIQPWAWEYLNAHPELLE